jgi:hypothetical protein
MKQAMDDPACIYESSSVGLKKTFPKLLQRDDSPADRSRVVADCQGPEIEHKACDICGRNAMQSYLLQYRLWQENWRVE